MSNADSTKSEIAGSQPDQPAALLIGGRPLRRNRRQPGGTVLGLAFDASSIQAVLVRRTNGSVEIRNQLSVPLSLNLLTDDPALVGREIQKLLAAAGIRERDCVVGLPLHWVLTFSTKLPDLTDSDLASFLQIEAERGFPYPPDALILASSRYKTPAGENYVLQVAVPRDHVARLQEVLKAAQLRPASFSLGISALQCSDGEPTTGVIALLPWERSVGMQICCGGGIAVLRTIEGATDLEGAGDGRFQIDQITRELRITLGQLPVDLREAARRVRIFGRNDAADELAEQLRPRLEPLGVSVEQVQSCTETECGLAVPPNTEISPALTLALRWLSGRGQAFEFLPPKVSLWQQFIARYSSKKLVTVGIAVGSLACLVLFAFLVQQVQLSYWRSKWAGMKPHVTRLEQLQDQIVRFRPWFDDSCRSLMILRRLSEAFPEDGAVSAKSIEVREPATVTVSGTARNNQALLRMMQQLRGVPGVRNVQLDTMRGQTPLQFNFNFQWTGAPQS